LAQRLKSGSYNLLKRRNHEKEQKKSNSRKAYVERYFGRVLNVYQITSAKNKLMYE
jgi:hypothetical protein